MYETILVERDDGIGTITLNRPEKRNAYVPQMGEDLVHAFRALRSEPEIRCVILTGAGRGFCAGVDLEALEAMQAGRESGKGPKLGEEDFVQGFPLELLEYPKPVIAAINGAAIGVGVTMTLPCDVRIAAEEAKLGVTFTKLGILPGLGSTHLLPRIVGMGKAQELVLTARVIRAPEALSIGLVNQVVAADALQGTARAMALEMAKGDPDALKLAKRALHFGADVSMAEAMAHERESSAVLREAKSKRDRSVS